MPGTWSAPRRPRTSASPRRSAKSAPRTGADRHDGRRHPRDPQRLSHERGLTDMAVTKVVMPKLSEAMETGKVIKWLRNEGDRVQSGDIVAEIETDKAEDRKSTRLNSSHQ